LWNIYKLDVIVIPTNRLISRHDEQDVIYKTKREKYAAVIEEVKALVDNGRPVLVGTTSVEISELLSKMLKLRGITHNVLNAKQHQSEAMIVQQAGHEGQVTIATNMAGRGTDIKLTDAVKTAGGLAIVGTERHESRRVDRQLRGRAGRQGDPGSSKFFVSLEDDLMRLFGSARIAKMMDAMGVKDGESIQAGMMTKAIERAQRKVEENNFGMRKRLLEYDDVMNSQREVIYTRRRHALSGQSIDLDINNMMNDFAAAFVENFRSDDLEAFRLEMISQLSIEPTVDEKQFSDLTDDELTDILVADMRTALARRSDTISRVALPVLQNIYKEQGEKFDNIMIPVVDGLRGFNVSVNLKKAIENGGAEIMRSFSKIIILVTIDDKWREHLRDMDDLKQSVQNASYEQKDPLLIYKFESFGLFKTMVDDINREVLSTLLKAFIPVQQNAPVREAPKPKPQDMSKLQTSRSEAALAAGSGDKQKPAPVHVEKQ
ncbi:MAG: preprotein translocase subunit SecA, partial [Mucinivorans sp.]